MSKQDPGTSSANQYLRGNYSYQSTLLGEQQYTATYRNDCRAPESNDFVSLISAISRMYTQRNYLGMDKLDLTADDRKTSPLGKGAVFTVKSFNITYDIPSNTRLGKLYTITSNVVYKQTKTLFNSGGSTHDQANLAGVMNEIRILSHAPLYWHPNIITILGIGWHFEQSGTNLTAQPRVVLELAQNTLEEYLKDNVDLPFQIRREIGLGISNGLAALHGCSIIHGDIKPANILMVLDYTAEDALQTQKVYIPKIADFSHSFRDDGLPRRMSRSTHGFMAPEVQKGSVVDNCKATDVYSLGVTLWQLLISNDQLPITSTTETGDGTLDAIHAVIDAKWEQTAASFSRRTFLYKTVDSTLANDPHARCLETLRSTLSQCSDASTTLQTEMRYRSGVVKDQLVRCLLNIANDITDPRQAYALFELGVCHISNFGDPRQSNIQKGVQFLIRAAEIGNITAKGYIWRLLSSFGELHAIAPGWQLQAKRWLLEAAAEGHEVAFSDYTYGYANLTRKSKIAHLRLAKRLGDSMPSLDYRTFQSKFSTQDALPTLANGDSVLHWAAELNLTEHIAYLLTSLAVNIDIQNNDGDTALVAACRVGQTDAAISLIKFGADVNLTNTNGETGLHYIWKFSDYDATSLLAIFVDKNINFNQASISPQDSTRRGIPIEFDPLPNIGELAIERVAARGRTKVVYEFLYQGPPLAPANGNVIRRMILDASRLTFYEIRELLVNYSRGVGVPLLPMHKYPRIQESMTDVEDTPWENNSYYRPYTSAIAQGWLSIYGPEWHTPEIFWRACCHGKMWKKNLEETVKSTMLTSGRCFCHSSWKQALLYSFNLKHTQFAHAFLKLLLHAKKRKMDGSSNEQNSNRAPEQPCSCDSKRNLEQHGSGFDYSSLNPLYVNGNQRTKAPLIDSFLCDKETLVQYTIKVGDRSGFRMLVDGFGADVQRPWSLNSNNSDSITTRFPKSGMVYLNCYSLLALYSKDIWFAFEFSRLGIKHNHLGVFGDPVDWLINHRMYKTDNIRRSQSVYLPPLFFSMACGFNSLTVFLLNHGARLDGPVYVETSPFCVTNVLDLALSFKYLRQDTAQFLFHNKGLYTNHLGNEEQISPTLLPTSMFTEDGGRMVFELLHKCLYHNDPGIIERLSQRIIDITARSTNPRTTLQKIRDLFDKATSVILLIALSLLSEFACLGPMVGPDMELNTIAQRGSFTILRQVWKELLHQYPGAQFRSQWSWRYMLPVRSMSMIELAITAGYKVEVAVLAGQDSRYRLLHGKLHRFLAFNHFDCTKECKALDHGTICHREHFVMELLLQDTIKHIKQSRQPLHIPHLFDILFFNEFDMLKQGSPEAQELYSLGYRNSLLSSFDFMGCLYLMLAIGFFIMPIVAGVKCHTACRQEGKSLMSRGTMHYVGRGRHIGSTRSSRPA
ncbi:hypothetical protein MferCBS49748_003023 [Microsporum ferrugineum]